MPVLPPTIEELRDLLADLPGLGPKSAQRIVLSLLEGPKNQTLKLAALLTKLHSATVRCARCFLLTEGAVNGRCRFCRDPRRDAGTICVVAHSTDVAPIEETAEYRGSYHVLGGVLNPLEGVTAEMLTLEPLKKRIESENPNITEVVLAFDQDVTGESTVLYIKNILAPYQRERGLVVSRLARGLPMNSTLEYTDQVTLANALKERRVL